MGGDVFAREEHLVRRRRLTSHSSGLRASNDLQSAMPSKTRSARTPMLTVG